MRCRTPATSWPHQHSNPRPLHAPGAPRGPLPCIALPCCIFSCIVSSAHTLLVQAPSPALPCVKAARRVTGPTSKYKADAEAAGGRTGGAPEAIGCTIRVLAQNQRGCSVRIRHPRRDGGGGKGMAALHGSGSQRGAQHSQVMPASFAVARRAPSPGSACATDALVTGPRAARSALSASIWRRLQWGRGRGRAVGLGPRRNRAALQLKPQTAVPRTPPQRSTHSASCSSVPGRLAVDLTRFTCRSRSFFLNSAWASRICRTCGTAGRSGVVRGRGSRGHRRVSVQPPALLRPPAPTPAHLGHGGSALGQGHEALGVLLHLLPAQRQHGLDPALHLDDSSVDLGVAAGKRMGRQVAAQGETWRSVAAGSRSGSMPFMPPYAMQVSRRPRTSA